ncbi:hypothetical protein CGH72_08545 [Vibrio parahaemolyticus]|uniref:hypothetical protein n=1 Tax=Vibrio TaxID=662 RepID=UPI0005F04544|nr:MULTISPECIES: hypothetical protein [Vibrio]TOK04625.1 hypothetical protein CGI25_22385 [Vibrio parahaemolyticus]TOM58932.1 hypothetical protein CGH75_11375 [Vibrio parahaemolyticus]TOM64766.1 hypothetical protein CGH73_20975 [Vibrio parahaemolyticus]TOM73416.1 hypothetical protein CGH72_08545 [Vibrio parahaemolyticus]TOO81901.1 hypothetical protein CGH29_21160 [Vibrio parahaemolyticus]
MNEHDIKEAVDAIMRLRPETKTDVHDVVNRLEIKRRLDEHRYQRELADINAGEYPQRKIDFFAQGKMVSQDALDKARFHIHDAR